MFNFKKIIFLPLICLVLVGCNESISQGSKKLDNDSMTENQSLELDSDLKITKFIEVNPMKEELGIREVEKIEIVENLERDGAELAIELPAPAGLTQYNVMQNIGWKVTNLGNMDSKRFQVNFNAGNGWSHYAGGGSNPYFGQSTGMSNLGAGTSYENIDMSGFGETGFYGKYNLHVCIDPDYYSKEEGLHNDGDPSNNCADKSIIVLDADATDAKVIVNGSVPSKRPFHVGDMARGLGFTLINVGSKTAEQYRVNLVIRPHELYGENTDPNLIVEKTEFNFNFRNLESGAELTRDISSPLMRFAAGRWYMNTCVFRKLSDGSEERNCDTLRAFNVIEYEHDSSRVGAELELAMAVQDGLVEGDSEISKKIQFNVKNTGDMTTKRFQVLVHLQNLESYGGSGSGQTGWGTGMGASNFPAGYDGNFGILGSSSNPMAGRWRIFGCIVPDYYTKEEALINDANGSNNCAYKEFEIALKEQPPEPEPENIAPVASFSESCVDLKCKFDSSLSSDSDGSIVSRAWDFGDGSSSSLKVAEHTFTSAGTYSVKLTVTDDDGATHSVSRAITVKEPVIDVPPKPEPQEIKLDVTSRKLSKGRIEFRLNWSGATSDSVDILRDGSKIVSTPNDGFYGDEMKGKKPSSYRVCESGTQICSEVVLTGF